MPYTKSTHKVEIVPIELEKHPNADSLSIIRIWGYQVVVKTEEWKNVKIGAYIVTDSVVPDTKQFEFLGDNKRIRVRRFRGVLSQGMLIPAPEGSRVGDDVGELLGITRYEPKEPLDGGGEDLPEPPGFRPKYDVDAWERYRHLFIDGEQVAVTEKLHGANARFAFIDGQFYCGSRKVWKKLDVNNLWWKCFEKNEWIKVFLEDYPEITIFGECFGNVQELKYGALKNDYFFRAFDLWDNKDGKFLSWEKVKDIIIPFARDEGFWEKNKKLDSSTLSGPMSSLWVPILYEGPYNEVLKDLAEGISQVPNADHIREGIVIQAVEERFSPEIGRIKLKVVNPTYLEKSK